MTESAGHVEIAIIRKDSKANAVGVRTKDDNAVAGKDYNKYEEIIKFEDANENIKVIKVGIINDEEWNPDLDFFVVLFDPTVHGGNDELKGSDTKTKVTILDEDFPGIISFTETEVRVGKEDKYVELKIERIDGSDGKINCKVKTESLFSPEQGATESANAVEFQDYVPHD